MIFNIQILAVVAISQAFIVDAGFLSSMRDRMKGTSAPASDNNPIASTSTMPPTNFMAAPGEGSAVSSHPTPASFDVVKKATTAGRVASAKKSNKKQKKRRRIGRKGAKLTPAQKIVRLNRRIKRLQASGTLTADQKASIASMQARIKRLSAVQA